MKVAELIARRQSSWRELEDLCSRSGRRRTKLDPQLAGKFAALYRAACADLALAEAYQLPPATVEYLQGLVARAHNQLYRGHGAKWRTWFTTIFEDTPRLIFNDRCVQVAFLIFWGLFLISAYLAYEDNVWPGFAEQVVGQQALDQYLESFEGFGQRSWADNSQMAGFYVFNNASIGLSCFVMMLFVLPGLITLSYNAVHIGAIFGFMFRPDLGEAGINFKNFVTAHAPLEITAIVLSAGAGLKIGMRWLISGGLARMDSMTKAAVEALPIAMCAVLLFGLAALIEGFISPATKLFVAWWVKGLVAVASSCLLAFYFVVLGYPHGSE